MNKNKMFKIVKPGTNEDVLGGAVTDGNAYVRAYPAPLPGQKHPLDLEVGESTLCQYSLSGSKGTYRVIRVIDTTPALDHDVLPREEGKAP